MRHKQFLSGLLAAGIMFSAVPLFPARAAENNWKEAAADIRQSISIHNPTGSELTDIPVLMRVDASQISSRNAMSFYTDEGTEELPYEVESWDSSGTGTVWVQVPALEADSDTVIWGYYNGDEAQNSTEAVWNPSYALVEHFGDLEFNTDSTGKADGEAAGALSAEAGRIGEAAVFNGSQKITYGPLLSNESEFTISTVVDYGKPGSWAGIAGRDKNGGVKEGDAYFLGINGGKGQFVGRVYDSNKTSYEVNAPFSEGVHLLTLSYNGEALEIYVDGVLKDSKNAAAGAVLSEPATNLTIGAYSDEEMINGLNGSYDELQISSTGTTEDYEAFRYANYLGNAVTMAPIEAKDGEIILTVSSPANQAMLEAGEVVFSGYVSEDAVFSYSVGNGEKVNAGKLSAGNYELSIPLYELGAQTVSITAVSAADAEDIKTVEVEVEVQDTTAPAQPVLSDSSVDGKQEYGNAVLSAQVEQEEHETSYVRFYEQESITLNDQNTEVLEGVTSAGLPTAIRPDAGTKADSLAPVTTGQDQTPYQIYRVALTEEQQKAGSYRFTWTGSAEREVSIYVYDYAASGWKLAGSGSGEGEFSIDLEIVNENILKEGTLSLLIWRGMNEALAGRDSYIASPEDYDFNLMWTSDTQFYAETPSYTPLMTQQFQWVIDHYDELKSSMFIHTGDLVNQANQRNQWERIDEAYKMIEEADIPYIVITGNHDQQGTSTDDNANYREFFPVSRLQAANPCWGGAYGDNYYYLMEENGMKVLILAMGMKWEKDDIEWANTVLETYPDYFGILMVHDYLTVAGEVELNSKYSDVKMLHDELVAVNDNIRLILCGHNHGANTNLEYFGDRPVYSILADYQSLAQGGSGYMRMLKFDVENDLIYVNTYSAYEDSTAYFTDQQAEKAGLYQLNKDEFVIQTDLGAETTRTLETASLKLSADVSSQIGETQEITGSGVVSVEWTGLAPEQEYVWFAVVEDQAGNETKTGTMSFTVGTDRSALLSILEEAGAYTDLEKYTEATAETFRTALANAENLGETASQKDINDAVKALRNAIDGLEEIVTEPTKPEEPETEPTEPEEPETEPTKPEEPETEPTKPEEPETEPTKPEEPETEPTKPEEPETEPTKPERPSETQGQKGENSAAPNTGDSSQTGILVFTLGISALAAGAIVISEKKKS